MQQLGQTLGFAFINKNEYQFQSLARSDRQKQNTLLAICFYLMFVNGEGINGDISAKSIFIE